MAELAHSQSIASLQPYEAYLVASVPAIYISQQKEGEAEFSKIINIDRVNGNENNNTGCFRQISTYIDPGASFITTHDFIMGSIRLIASCGSTTDQLMINLAGLTPDVIRQVKDVFEPVSFTTGTSIGPILFVLHINDNPKTRYAELIATISGVLSACKTPIMRALIFGGISHAFNGYDGNLKMFEYHESDENKGQDNIANIGYLRTLVAGNIHDIDATKPESITKGILSEQSGIITTDALIDKCAPDVLSTLAYIKSLKDDDVIRDSILFACRCKTFKIDTAWNELYGKNDVSGRATNGETYGGVLKLLNKSTSPMMTGKIRAEAFKNEHTGLDFIPNELAVSEMPVITATAARIVDDIRGKFEVKKGGKRTRRKHGRKTRRKRRRTHRGRGRK